MTSQPHWVTTLGLSRAFLGVFVFFLACAFLIWRRESEHGLAESGADVQYVVFVSAWAEWEVTPYENVVARARYGYIITIQVALAGIGICLQLSQLFASVPDEFLYGRNKDDARGSGCQLVPPNPYHPFEPGSVIGARRWPCHCRYNPVSGTPASRSPALEARSVE